MGDDNRRYRSHKKRKREHEWEGDLAEGLGGLAEGLFGALGGTLEAIGEVADDLKQDRERERYRDKDRRRPGDFEIRVESRHDRHRRQGGELREDWLDRKEERSAPHRSDRREHRQGPMPAPIAPREIPPEAPPEFAARLGKAFVHPFALLVLGAMLIGGLSGQPSLIVGAIIFYLAIVSAVFTRMGLAREKRLRTLVAQGQPLPSPVRTVGEPQRRVVGGHTPAPVPTDNAGQYFQRLEALVTRLKGKAKADAAGLIDPAQLDNYVKVAQEYLTKYREVAAYLASVGGAAAARHDCEQLQAQIEDQRRVLPAEDPRFDSWERLLQAKQRTASNLSGLEHFLLAVEAKLAEQVAMLESLDSSLIRHSLGSFQQQQSVEEELFTQEVTTLSHGLEENTRAMETELRRISGQLV